MLSIISGMPASLAISFIVEISVITPPGFASDSANTALTS